MSGNPEPRSDMFEFELMPNTTSTLQSARYASSRKLAASNVSHDTLYRTTHGNVPPPGDVYGTEEGQQSMIWKQAQQDLTLRMEVEVPESGKVRPIDILDALPKASRILYSRVHSYRDPRWPEEHEGWYILISTKRENLLPPQPFGYSVIKEQAGRHAFIHPAWKDMSLSEIELLREELHRVCERLSLNPGSYSTSQSDILAALCLRRVSSLQKSWHLSPINLWHENGELICGSMVTILDASSVRKGELQTIKPATAKIKLYAKTVESAHTVPNIAKQFSVPSLPSVLPEAVCHLSEQTQRKAYRIALWLQTMLQFRVMTAQGAKVYISALLHSIGVFRSREKFRYRDSIYRGSRLTEVSRNETDYAIKPSVALKADVLSGNFPPIRVPLSADALIRTIDALDTAFIRTSSARMAWEQAAKRADLEWDLFRDSGGLDIGVQQCFCTDQDRMATLHTCYGCTNRLFCAALVRIGDKLVCAACAPDAFPASDLTQVSTLTFQTGVKCKSCTDGNVDCDQTFPSCQSCLRSSTACHYRGHDEHGRIPDIKAKLAAGKANPFGIGQAASGYSRKERPKRNQKERQKKSQKKALKKRLERSAYHQAFTSFSRGFRQDVLDMDYPDDQSRKAAIAERRKLLVAAWDTFCQTYQITEKDWLDVFLQRKRRFSDAQTNDELRYPFALSADALDHVVAHEGNTSIHGNAPNQVPTAYYLNKLKYTFSAQMLQLVSKLCNNPTTRERDNILRQISHLYLIRLQLPLSRKGRLSLDAADPVIEKVLQQTRTGLADPEACQAIRKPWELQGRRSASPKPFPNEEIVGNVIKEIESNSGYTFHRVGGVVFPFDPLTAPGFWDWESNRAYYGQMLHTMTRLCNKDFITTCKIDTLFLLHCIQVANPPPGMDWLRRSLVPYVRHGLRASGGHRIHHQDMQDGFADGYTSLRDFDDALCNIDIEPWIWNVMRGDHDHLYDRMVNDLRSLPADNPPYWKDAGEEQVPSLPEIHPGVKQTSGKRSKSKRNKSTRKEPELPSRNSSQPKGRPQRANLANRGNICYVSSVLQVLFNIPELRTLVDTTERFPFKVETGRGNYTFVKLGDPGFAIYRRVFEHLRRIAKILHQSPSTKFSPDMTLAFMKELRTINRDTFQDFEESQEDDAARFLDTLLTMFNDAGDHSSVIQDEARRPTTVLMNEQDRRIKEGVLLDPLEEEAKRARRAYRETGNSTLVDLMCTLSVVQESECEFPGCLSPFARSYSFERMVNLVLPSLDDFEARGIELQAGTPGPTISNLIEYWSHASGAALCEHDPGHGLKAPARKKIFTTPPVLILRLERLEVTSGLPYSEGHARYKSDPVMLEESIDLRPWCERLLPSEDALGSLNVEALETRYDLAAVIEFSHSGRHYVTIAKAPDLEKNEFWALFDDLRARAEWTEAPHSKARGSSYVVVYNRKSPADKNVQASNVGRFQHDGDRTDTSDTSDNSNEEDEQHIDDDEAEGQAEDFVEEEFLFVDNEVDASPVTITELFLDDSDDDSSSDSSSDSTSDSTSDSSSDSGHVGHVATLKSPVQEQLTHLAQSWEVLASGSEEEKAAIDPMLNAELSRNVLRLHKEFEAQQGRDPPASDDTGPSVKNMRDSLQREVETLQERKRKLQAENEDAVRYLEAHEMLKFAADSKAGLVQEQKSTITETENILRKLRDEVEDLKGRRGDHVQRLLAGKHYGEVLPTLESAELVGLITDASRLLGARAAKSEPPKIASNFPPRPLASPFPLATYKTPQSVRPGGSAEESAQHASSPRSGGSGEERPQSKIPVPSSMTTNQRHNAETNNASVDKDRMGQLAPKSAASQPQASSPNYASATVNSGIRAGTLDPASASGAALRSTTPITSRSSQAPGTSEQVRVGDRRRLGHISQDSPMTGSVAGPQAKKLRQDALSGSVTGQANPARRSQLGRGSQTTRPQAGGGPQTTNVPRTGNTASTTSRAPAGNAASTTNQTRTGGGTHTAGTGQTGSGRQAGSGLPPVPRATAQPRTRRHPFDYSRAQAGKKQ